MKRALLLHGLKTCATNLFQGRERLVMVLAEKDKNLVFLVSCNQEPRPGGPEAEVLKPRTGREIGSQEIIFGDIGAFFDRKLALRQRFSAPVAT